MAERAALRAVARQTGGAGRPDRHQPYDPSLDRSVDVHIACIRAAIRVEDAKHPRHIITVRGAGYVFAKGGRLMRRLYFRIYLACWEAWRCSPCL